MSSEGECGFCGKRANEVRALVEGPNVHICNECVDLCGDIVRPRPDEPPSTRRRKGARSGDDALRCSFCGKPEHEVAKLLAGIERFICDGCIEMARADLEAHGVSAHAGEAPPHYCSFCGKHQGDVARMIAGPAVNICSECVALCQNTVAQRATAESVDKPAAQADGDDHPQLYCSFCGEPATGGRRLIAGPTVFICHDCVTICVDLCAGKEVPGANPSDDG